LRELAFPLIILGTVQVAAGVIFFGVPAISPVHVNVINVYPVPPSPIERCTGVLVPFPYPWSCPPNYVPLTPPFDSLPVVPMIFLTLGILSVVVGFLKQRRRLKLVFPSLSAGLVLMVPTSQIGFIGNQGVPINWILYPMSHPPLSNFYPLYVVAPAFVADWMIFSSIAGIAIFLIFRQGIIWRSGVSKEGYSKGIFNQSRPE